MKEFYFLYKEKIKMSKVLKGVMVYTGVLLGIVIVLSGIIGGVMFLTAGANSPFTVFGYKAIYLSNVQRDNQQITTSAVADGSLIDLTVDAGNFDVNIVQVSDTTPNIIVKKTDNLFGIYTGEYNPDAVLTFDTDTLEATITVAQFDGLISYGESAITIILPSIKEFQYNLTLVTNSGDIALNGYQTPENEGDETNTLDILELSVTTGNGNFNMKNIGEHVELATTGTEGEEDYSVIPAHLALELQKLYLNTNGGRFNIVSDEEGLDLYVQVSDTSELGMEIDSENGDFYFDKMFGYINIHGKDIRIDADSIDTWGQGFDFDSPTGYFAIGEIITEAQEGQEEVDMGANTINTETVNVSIDKISGETSIKTTYGNINIEELVNGATLRSDNGNITVGVANGNFIAESTYGNIAVESYKAVAYFKTEKGSITATYTGDVTAIGIDNHTEAYNKDGVTTLNNVFGNLTLTVTGNGSATVTFAEFANSSTSQHNITMAKGNATLRVLLTQAFRFSATGNVRGTLSNINIADLISQNGQGVIIPVLNADANTPLITVNAGEGATTFASYTSAA